MRACGVSLQKLGLEHGADDLLPRRRGPVEGELGADGVGGRYDDAGGAHAGDRRLVRQCMHTAAGVDDGLSLDHHSLFVD